MENVEAEDSIRQYLLDNYEFILSELLPLIDYREELLHTHPSLTQDIKEQFRWSVGSILIQMVNTHHPEIPAEDVHVFIRSMDVEHFLTLGIHT